MKLIIDKATNETIATTTDVNFTPDESTQIMIDAPVDFDESVNMRDYHYNEVTQTVSYIEGSASPIVIPNGESL